ncbi:TIGR03087 family PEP-CTERM/XrtA system glycosyltransferase [Neiella marina]|uniref:TIGR03087 family PEP-CTERM/XrtA system glycosyltransferase n=1 Tax=Neiella holothuriorum TaxID=2870530 RepID=A0ABS7EH19_9GAMM|nr:TIGR03087 family PEP-CTERM/XrtA system glycosyltransferase [Neiella holothuriorum]MBW8191642.1 TIGR03087 family PEP-CTERM/XrtA system glycosyltransferase [Neiella holothuriorum]
MKQPLLYLCHRIPFPPNKGDKIRSFNQLAYLSKKFDVYLGCFVDEPSDMAYTKELSQYVKGMYVQPLNKRHATFRGVMKMGRSNPITLPYYFDPKMAQWVNNTIANFSIRNILVYCSSMAQYVDSPQYQKLNRVVDFVDLDSDKWRQYAKSQTFPKSWVYNREFRTLLAYEQKLTEQFNASVFISSNEVDLFCQLSNISSHSRIHAVSNGVDLAFFDPQLVSSSSRTNTAPTVVFTGAMDYWANIDAVRWFVKHVWPYVTKQIKDARLLVVGSNPSDKIRELDAFPNIEVTGKVDDIRSYIQSGWVSIAPMRIARGVQNKVLEAMAMEIPVVATSLAMEGLVTTTGCNVAIEDNEESFANAVVEQLGQRTNAPENRDWIVRHYRWEEQLNVLYRLLEKSV